MNITSQNIVGDLVAQDYRTAPVFKKHGIDFCCKGNRTIAEACQSKEKEIDPLLNELNEILNQHQKKTQNYQDWSMDFLADYIVNTHHVYVRKRIEEIPPFLNKVCNVHGHASPELHEIQFLFSQAADDLCMHMMKEEQILFPYIKILAQSLKTVVTPEIPPYGTVENPIRMMRYEHELEGDRFSKISNLSNNYTPPEWGCKTYQVVYALLKEFEEDLHMHIHLENNILFQKAIEAERTLNMPVY